MILLTFPIGIGMGLAGAILPVTVKERFADRPGFATGVYTTGITIGSALAAATAVPLAHLAGGWRAPLFVFGAVSTGLAVLWLWLTRTEPAHRRANIRPLRLPIRRLLAWRLVAAFFFMSSVFYGLNAWLPDAYVERGWSESSAGGLLAVLNTVTIPCGFLVAWAADHWGARRDWLAGAASLQFVALLGILLWPAGGWGWVVLLGLAIGPLFPLTMTLPLDAADRPAEVAALAGMMLGVGYTLSALSPLLLGALRDVTGGFDAVLGALVGRIGGADRRRRVVQSGAARSRSIVRRTPSSSGVQLIGPTASSSAPLSNSSGNGSSVASSTVHETSAAASIARAASATATAGPPRLKTRAPSTAARAAATKTRAASGANWSCVRPPKAICEPSPRAAAAIARLGDAVSPESRPGP